MSHCWPIEWLQILSTREFARKFSRVNFSTHPIKSEYFKLSLERLKLCQNGVSPLILLVFQLNIIIDCFYLNKIIINSTLFLFYFLQINQPLKIKIIIFYLLFLIKSVTVILFDQSSQQCYFIEKLTGWCW